MNPLKEDDDTLRFVRVNWHVLILKWFDFNNVGFNLNCRCKVFLFCPFELLKQVCKKIPGPIENNTSSGG
jgi:hypothetical protein